MTLEGVAEEKQLKFGYKFKVYVQFRFIRVFSTKSMAFVLPGLKSPAGYCKSYSTSFIKFVDIFLLIPRKFMLGNATFRVSHATIISVTSSQHTNRYYF